MEDGWKIKMPQAGFEPARVAPLPPQDSVSANSTTAAFNEQKKIERIN
jgi:hypothetical protein